MHSFIVTVLVVYLASHTYAQTCMSHMDCGQDSCSEQVCEAVAGVLSGGMCKTIYAKQDGAPCTQMFPPMTGTCISGKCTPTCDSLSCNNNGDTCSTLMCSSINPPLMECIVTMKQMDGTPCSSIPGGMCKNGKCTEPCSPSNCSPDSCSSKTCGPNGCEVMPPMSEGTPCMAGPPYYGMGTCRSGYCVSSGPGQQCSSATCQSQDECEVVWCDNSMPSQCKSAKVMDGQMCQYRDVTGSMMAGNCKNGKCRGWCSPMFGCTDDVCGTKMCQGLGCQVGWANNEGSSCRVYPPNAIMGKCKNGICSRSTSTSCSQCVSDQCNIRSCAFGYCEESVMPDNHPCTYDNNGVPATGTCQLGECKAPCSPSTCGDSCGVASCINGICVVTQELLPYGSTCGSGGTCRNGRCTAACNTATNCKSDTFCGIRSCFNGWFCYTSQVNQPGSASCTTSLGQPGTCQGGSCAKI